MIRIAMTVKIRPDLIEEYKQYHRNVWPEIEQMQRRLGFRNVSIFFSGDTLFLYQEYCGDKPIEGAWSEYTSNEKCREWESLMSKFQVASPNSLPGIKWARTEEVYHFGG